MGSPRRDTSGKETVEQFGDADDERHYTSLSTWETTRVDCVGDSTCYVLECYRDQTSYAQQVNVSGGTVSSTYFRVIRAASSARHAGVTGAGIKFTSTSTTVIASDEDYFSVEDIEALNTGYNGAGTVTGIGLSNAVGQTAVNCISKCTNAGSGASYGINLLHYTAGDGGYAYNCLAYECTSGSGTGAGFIVDSRGGGSGCYSCTAVSCTTYGFRDNNGTATLFKGCGAPESGDYANADGFSGGDLTDDNLTTAPTFNNPGSDDFRLSSSDTAWVEGADNYAAWATFDTDVADTTRPQGDNWDVGFYEVPEEGGETYELVMNNASQAESISSLVPWYWTNLAPAGASQAASIQTPIPWYRTNLAVAAGTQPMSAETPTPFSLVQLAISSCTQAHLAGVPIPILRLLLAPASGSQTLIAPNIAAALRLLLAPANASQALSAENISFVTALILVLADASQALITSPPVPWYRTALAPATASSALKADSITLAARIILAMAGASQATAADALTLTVISPGAPTVYTLAMADAMSAHTAGSIIAALRLWLTMSGAYHGHAAESPSLALRMRLTPASAYQAMTAEALATFIGVTLAPANATQAITSGQVSLLRDIILQMADTVQALKADAPALRSWISLVVQSGSSAQSLEQLLASLRMRLGPASAYSGMTADAVSLSISVGAAFFLIKLLAKNMTYTFQASDAKYDFLAKPEGRQ